MYTLIWQSPTRSLEDFMQAIVLCDDSIESLRDVAIQYRNLGDFDKAVRHYGKIIRLESGDSSVSLPRRIVLEQLEAERRWII